MTSAGPPLNDAAAGEVPDATMHVIPAEERYRLLRTQEIGRLALIAEHYPLNSPVNYALDGTALVIRTHTGTIRRAAEHANVCFEVDEIDRRTRIGWSVLVRGQAAEVGDAHRADLVAPAHRPPESSRGRPARRGTGSGSSRTRSRDGGSFPGTAGDGCARLPLTAAPARTPLPARGRRGHARWHGKRDLRP